MKSIYTIALLVLSNTFMTFAWYGHLKFKEWKWFEGWPLVVIILISWGMVVFSMFTLVLFKNETFKWNHLLGFVFLILAVYFIFKK